MRSHVESRVPEDAELQIAVLDAMRQNAQARTRVVRKIVLAQHGDWRGIPERRVRRFVRQYRDEFSVCDYSVASQATTASSSSTTAAATKRSVGRRAKNAVQKVFGMGRRGRSIPKSEAKSVTGAQSKSNKLEPLEETHHEEDSPVVERRRHVVPATNRESLSITPPLTGESASTKAAAPVNKMSDSVEKGLRNAMLALPDITGNITATSCSVDEGMTPLVEESAPEATVKVEEKQLAHPADDHPDSIYFDDNDGKQKEKVCEPCEGCTIL